MLRFKLANGGTIASCKQPLQNKDFDRIVCSSCYANQYQYTYLEICIVNPSTHILHKSFNHELYLSVTPVPRRNRYFPYRGKTINCIRLDALHTGYNLIEFEEEDMVDWIRDNINVSSRFEEEHIRYGEPWDPGSHTCRHVRSKMSRLTINETTSPGGHGYVYNGKLSYGVDEDQNPVYVRDKILISIWKWNGKKGGQRHMRHMITSKPYDVYLSYVD